MFQPRNAREIRDVDNMALNMTSRRTISFIPAVVLQPIIWRIGAIASLVMLQLAIGATASLAQNSAEPEASVQPVQMRAAARDIAPLPMETERTLDGMPPVALMRFAAGSAIFHADWIPAPNVSDGADGLGPLYNATSCNGCHGLDNKTATRTDEQDRGRNVSKARVIRFEDPDPVYGRQLQDHAIDGFLPEGRAVVTWKRRQVRLNDGTQVVLRQPITTISDVGYGALAEKTEIHLRRVPPIEGLGLIAAIAAADIAANADPDDRDHDGVSGRVGRSVDAHTGKPVLARFGWKASAVSLATQTEDAFALDMGLSSPDKPDKSGDCTLKQAACFSAPGGGSSAKAGNEVSADEIALVAAFLEGLAPPPARKSTDDVVEKLTPPALPEIEEVGEPRLATSVGLSQMSTTSLPAVLQAKRPMIRFVEPSVSKVPVGAGSSRLTPPIHAASVPPETSQPTPLPTEPILLVNTRNRCSFDVPVVDINIENHCSLPSASRPVPSNSRW